MSGSMKKPIYWVIYMVLFIGGLALSRFRVLPVVNTTIFLFGFMWIWNGVSLLLCVNPYYGQKYGRTAQIVFSLADIGLGITWFILSQTQLSQQGLPVLLVSFPFVAIDGFLFFRHRRKQESPE
jgi:hypothetical protein